MQSGLCVEWRGGGRHETSRGFPVVLYWQYEAVSRSSQPPPNANPCAISRGFVRPAATPAELHAASPINYVGHCR